MTSSKKHDEYLKNGEYLAQVALPADVSRTSVIRSVVLAALSSLSAATAAAQGAGSVASALCESKPILDLRLRSESVEQDGMAEDASAITLRGRLGFETGKAWNTSLLAEADLLWPLDTEYNSTVNGKTAYPVVADPETYEINRLQLTNTSLPGTTITLGRQRIALDDHRFVGNVGWRQNEQTFDSVRIVTKPTDKITVDVAYISQVNRVFSKESPVGRYEGDSFLGNLSWQTPVGKVTGFAHFLEFDEAPTDSVETFGIRVAGERAVGRAKIAYTASYAVQREYADNPLDYSADYYGLEVTGTLRNYSAGVGIEVLEGDGTKGFSTPLATLHRYQGWTDKFLTTPPDGIDDRYVTLGYTAKGLGVLETVSATMAYHVYESQRQSIDYGSEINVQLQAKWRRFSGVLKYADYNADAFTTDTRKLWAQVEYTW